MSDGPFWSEIGLIMQKLSEADRVTLIQHQRKSEDAVRAEALDMGRRMERASIVAWICEELADKATFLVGHEHRVLGGFANMIERGEHEKGSGE